MKDLTCYADSALSQEVRNDIYFMSEVNHIELLLALVAEEFVYTPEQLSLLKSDLEFLIKVQ